MNKNYNVTFTYNENKEWKPKITRTVQVDCESEYAAMLIVANKFDSVKVDDKTKFWIPANKKIHIDKVKEIKEKTEKVSK